MYDDTVEECEVPCSDVHPNYASNTDCSSLDLPEVGYSMPIARWAYYAGVFLG